DNRVRRPGCRIWFMHLDGQRDGMARLGSSPADQWANSTTRCAVRGSLVGWFVSSLLGPFVGSLVRSCALARRIASADGWPSYFGAPRLSSAAIGRQLLAAELKVRIDIAMKILDGGGERQFQRYSSIILDVPGVADVTGAASKHDAAVEAMTT